MTILFINSIGKNKWGGGEKWIVNTAHGLQQLGHKVIVGGRRNAVLIKAAQEKGIDTTRINYCNDFSLFSSLQLTQYINKHRVSVIVASLNRDVRVAGFAAMLSKHKPRVIGRQGVQLITKKWKYKFTFKNFSHGILTNSLSLKKIYDSYNWWDDTFVKVIYNGIAETQPCLKPFNYASICELTPQTKVILSAGRLDKQKGFGYLVKAAKIAKEKNEDFKFFIAGTGKQFKYLSKLIADNELKNHVFLLGFVEDIHSLFKGADVFVLPSLYEGMPNVLLESMLEMVPVVTTPVNGAAELVEESKTGFFIPTKDANAIYEKIKFVLNNPQITQQIAAQAKETVLEKFSLDKSVQLVDAYLLEILKERDTASISMQLRWFEKVISKLRTFGHKNFKPAYYLKNYLKLKLLPPFNKNGIHRIIKSKNLYSPEYLSSRVNYYNKLNSTIIFDDSIKSLKEFVFTGEEKTYYFDTWRYTRLFDPNHKLAYKFGDVTTVPANPSIVKSRPILGNNKNSILLNLNYIRHFIFVKDRYAYLAKKNLLVWRGNVWTYQPHRIDFFQKHFENPLCNIGHVNKADFDSTWLTDKLTIDEQLKYKFILSIEGNDVATNLKWIMSSNSIAVMPTPKYETWFMEGTLKPDYHYIHIKDDYSDLNEKLNFYIRYPEKAEEIRINANKYVSQFKNKKREKLISVLVLEKYFEKTGHLPSVR
ncbi:Glycosyltransferase involved in cell wall bisynthesis [Saccharicrinis carchari]|uniref:Glycosyltransferase involved in cell wall bisynthesis n=1 Tax=Saccharicrinis carchari TaxID=1168039 RepID=A0A521CFC6_SACCC|nr:glycosyl transferase family 90 [Saccharicrinis carchari]SMO58102.1 Glycosyltransferase involved in cell wall bisynthesis [Saccharicrinis carchari]